MRRRYFLFIPYLFSLLILAACTTEYNLATNRQETLLYGTEKEIRIGDTIARQIEEKYKVNTDVDINERAQRILDRIVAVCDRHDLVYTIRIINEDYLNAVSLPGGYIYVFKGLMDKVKNDDQLAGIIAHEVGHINARHAIKRLQAMYSVMLMQVLAAESGSREALAGVNALATTVFLSYSRKDEFESDKLAVKYTKGAGYDPEAMIGVLDILKEDDAKSIKRIRYFRTHPYLNERMSALGREITGELKFEDYLNLTGNEF